jgi:two-component system NtrC family sensor kinase
MIEKVDLNELLEEMAELMRREALSKGIRFETDFDPRLPPLRSDPSQLQQVFLNLITNAIDAHEGKDSGVVIVRTRTEDEGEKVLVQVEDRGMGIRPELIGKIFDPFFTTKPPGKGTGLGLAICRSIMERLKGGLTVESDPGEGAMFTVSLPVGPGGKREWTADKVVRLEPVRRGRS